MALADRLKIRNILFWYIHGDDEMAAKPCPIHGWVDKQFQDCVGCRQCVESERT